MDFWNWKFIAQGEQNVKVVLNENYQAWVHTKDIVSDDPTYNY